MRTAMTIGLALCALTVSARSAASRLDPSLEVRAEQRYDDDPLIRSANAGNGELVTKLSTEIGLKAKADPWHLDAWYSPDLLIHEQVATDVAAQTDAALTGVTLEHRGRVQFDRKFSDFTDLNGDFRLWRVTDPTSLPRLGVGRTLDPILYGIATLELRQLVSHRVGLRFGEHFEAAKIFYQTWEVGPANAASTHGVFGGVTGTCGPGSVQPHTGQPVACIPADETAAGVVNAPFAEAFYKLSRRAELGLGERVQFFSFGAGSGIASGPYLEYRLRITREAHFTVSGGPVWFADHPAPPVTLDGVTTVRADGSGVIPRLNLELGREGPQLAYGLNAGHDLVGASGFTDALWADYAGLALSYRIFVLPLKFFGGSTYYRNGSAPNAGVLPLFGTSLQTSAGYSLEAGVEWRISRKILAQAVYDRFQQIGRVYLGAQPNLTTNIMAVRLGWTAL